VFRSHVFPGDLHIHSFGASYDVTDAGATPEAIVAEAKNSSLSIIALTDHNEISNVGRGVEAVASA
jgi:predicted metal-dependent phosphoesterase TrpH